MLRVLSRFLALAATLLAASASRAGTPEEPAPLAELPFLAALPGFGPLAGDTVAIDVGRGRPLPLLVDTGSVSSVLTPRHARALGIVVRRDRARPLRRATRLGRNIEMWIETGGSDTSHASALQLGVMGMYFLRDFVVEIDFVQRVVRFFETHRARVDPEHARQGEWVLPLHVLDARPGIELWIAGRACRFVVDTGAAVPLLLGAERARALGLRPGGGTAHPTVALRHLYGESRALVHDGIDLRVGSHRLGPNRLLVEPRRGPGIRASRLAGPDSALVGTGFLSRFHVRFDFRRGWVGLTPVGDDARDKVQPALGALAPEHSRDAAADGTAARSREGSAGSSGDP